MQADCPSHSRQTRRGFFFFFFSPRTSWFPRGREVSDPFWIFAFIHTRRSACLTNQVVELERVHHHRPERCVLSPKHRKSLRFAFQEIALQLQQATSWLPAFSAELWKRNRSRRICFYLDDLTVMAKSKEWAFFHTVQ